MPKHIKTPKQYSKDKAKLCPVCGSSQLKKKSPRVQIDTKTPVRTKIPTKCQECKSTWVENFILRGYTHLHIRKDLDINQDSRQHSINE